MRGLENLLLERKIQGNNGRDRQGETLTIVINKINNTMSATDVLQQTQNHVSRGGGLFYLNLYGGVPTVKIKIFFTRLQKFRLHMTPDSRHSWSTVHSKTQKVD